MSPRSFRLLWFAVENIVTLIEEKNVEITFTDFQGKNLQWIEIVYDLSYDQSSH